MKPLVGLSLVALLVGCGGRSLPVADPQPTTTTTSTIVTTTTTTSSLPAPRPTSSLADPAESTVPDQSGSAPMITWNGVEQFSLGANLPWYNWGCDFGCGQGARESFGVSSDEVFADIAATLQRSSESGMSVVRWWMFPGEPWQFETDAEGLPTGLVPAVYDDLEAAVALATVTNVSLVLTLFSAPSEIPEEWRATEQGRAALIATLSDLFARYGSSDQIFTWQLVNEPEWEIDNGVVELEPLQSLVRDFAAAVHEHSQAQASIGSANLEGIEYWLGTGLDYYTAHWYDPMSSGLACAICTTYADVQRSVDVDAPIVIGEFYGGPDVGVTDRLESFRDRGYAGAWAWSLLPEMTADGLAIDDVGVAAFAAELSPPDTSPDGE